METNSVNISQLTYEQAFSELDVAVAALEAGDQSLEAAMSLFERGQALARHCTDLLDQAELKVRQIAGDELIEFAEP